jgi:hypothetical protein
MRSMKFALALLASGAISTATLAGEPSLQDTTLGQTDQVQVGTGVICDTQAEVTDFVNMMGDRDPGNALQTINSRSQSPMACGMATVAFRAGKSLGEVRTSKGSFNIVEIEIVAGAVDGSWQMIPRRTQYTAVAVKGIDI